MASAFVEAIAAVDVEGDTYRRLIGDVSLIGDREIMATSAMSHRLVDLPIRAMLGTVDGRSPIARNLAALRAAVEELDPRRRRPAGRRRRKLLGVIPLGDPVQDALAQYAKRRGHIETIIAALTVSRSRLEGDNAAIAQEIRALTTEMETLRQYAELTRVLDETLDRRIASLETSDPDRARALRTDVLFPIRQRLRDLLTQLAVAFQGQAALRMVEANNREVARAIRTATTTTAAALRTSLAVVQATADQRRIRSHVLADQRATTGEVDLAAVKAAWDNVFVTLDQVDSYSVSAFEAMQAAVQDLAGEVERSRAALERGTQAGGPTPGLESRVTVSSLRIS